MKIGIMTDALDDWRGLIGIGRYVGTLVDSLTTVDHNNQYVLIHHTDFKAPIYQKNAQLLVPLQGTWRRRLGKYTIVPRALERSGCDLVHYPDGAGIFASRTRYKKVVTIHDLSDLLFSETHRGMPFLRRLYRQTSRLLALKHFDRFIVPSESTKRDLQKHLSIPGDKITVTYEGVSPLFKPGVAGGAAIRQKYDLPPSFILSVSTLEPRKNLTTLIKAYDRLRKKGGLKQKLVLCGRPGWKYAGIYQAVEDMGLKSEVIFPGYAPESDLIAIYNMADLFVYPSLYEGFGLPPLEAMACGVPVITSNVSSLPEVVGEAGIMVDPVDVDGLANAMNSVLTNPARHDEMVQKGLQRAALFTWERAALATVKVYEDVVKAE